MRHTLASLVIVPSVCVSACSSNGGNDPAERDPLVPYPATGKTQSYDFVIDENVAWEVGPAAIYDAITYNQRIPGPTIEVTAGDHVRVTLTNNATQPHSVHTHVSEFTIDNDGVDEASLVQPGETKTIEWDPVFPGTFPYHDHGEEGNGVTRGLFGAVIVHAPDETPAHEQLVILSDFDQTSYLQLPGVADPKTGQFPVGGTYRGGHQYMHTINGKAYEDAVVPFEAELGERVRWRVISMGQEFHTWHVHGHRWLDPSGTLTDNVALGPGMYSTFEFDEANAGDWLVHCHVPNHMEGGMMARYLVR